ncbi:hypothetical protein [Aquimarina sp. 2304DJ70-9]|uniref:hypothetical protein n=1 Tax=Aquimarina penaris TaxID=3231044 RepID=UPI003461AD2C
MKNSILKTSILAMSLVVVFIACEKSEEVFTKESIEFTNEEIQSETDTHDHVVSNKEVKVGSVLHMRFDKNLSEEEAELTWNSAVKDYLIKNPNLSKGVSTEAYYQVVTKTGSQVTNGTDALVQASADFNHSGGSFHTDYITLNNPGDDREEGQKDFYLIRIYFPNITISWIEVEHAHIRLQGTDGWVVSSFKTKLLPEHQTVPATGVSKVVTYPEIWLTNANAGDWDYYYTGVIGTGRLNF